MKHRWAVDFLDCNGRLMSGHSQRFFTRWSAHRFAAEKNPGPDPLGIGMPLWTTKVSKL